MAEKRARTKRAALERFLSPLRQVLSTVADPVVTAYFESDDIAVLTYADRPGALDAGPARLRGDADVGLLLDQRLQVVETDIDGGPYRMHTLQYTYEIVQCSTGEEIFAFHYGQDGPPPENPAARMLSNYAHLHLGSASDVRDELVGAHVPTGRISVEDVVLLALEIGLPDGARPTVGWETVIGESRAKFREFQTGHR